MNRKKNDSYRMRTPCANCPFRTDVRPYLMPERVDEIEAGLMRSEFPCHKTSDHSQDEDEYVPTGQEAHCAGALILLEKIERPSQMMRISERLGLYDRSKLDMNAPVYDSFEGMREAMESELHR